MMNMTLKIERNHTQSTVKHVVFIKIAYTSSKTICRMINERINDSAKRMIKARIP